MEKASKAKALSGRLISDVRWAGESLVKPLTTRRLRTRLCNPDFTIIASNCIGTKVYQELGLEYNTPFVGLFLYAPCFVKLANRLEHYLKSEIRFTDKCRYQDRNYDPSGYRHYPVGLLDNDVELHFINYKDVEEARSKWTRRLERVNMKNLFFTFTDRDLCDERLVKQFDAIPYDHKVCFTAKEQPGVESLVCISEYTGQASVADLYSNFHILRRHFDFIDWLNGGPGRHR